VEALDVHEGGELSKDGLFSYEEVECLGACEYAPMMRLDHRYEKDLTPQKIDILIADRRSPSTAVVAHAPLVEGGLPPGGAGPGGASSRRTPLSPLPAGEREKAKPKPRARKPKSG
jgi:hypothetical protein